VKPRRKGVIPSQEIKDKISVSMRGNKNAVGAVHVSNKKKRVKRIDHVKIFRKFTELYKKHKYNKSVAKSAALLMFMEASHEERVKYMKRVRKITK